MSIKDKKTTESALKELRAQVPELFEMYDFSQFKYVNALTKCTVVCPTHGPFDKIFNKLKIQPKCPKCTDESDFRGKSQRHDLDAFKKRFEEVWGDAYDISEFVYVNSKVPGKLICKVAGHPPFYKDSNHLFSKTNPQGCPLCSQEKVTASQRNNWEDLKSRLTKHQLEINDYSQVNYKSMSHKVTIRCRIHDLIYETSMSNHLKPGAISGCSLCMSTHKSVSQVSTTEEFIEKAKLVSGDTVDFSKVNYIKSRVPVTLICKQHGEYRQAPGNFINGRQGCKQCETTGTSKGEVELGDFIESLGPPIIRNTRNVIPPRELDVYVPSLNIAFEYNGLYFHSEKFHVDKNYHLTKYLEAKNKGIRLIQIFEDEWVRNRGLVETKIRHILGKSILPKAGARKLFVRVLSSTETSSFLKETHIQGPGKFPMWSYGLVDAENKILACMTFITDRFSNKESTDIEILRYSTSTIVNGGFSKLLKAFIKDTNFKGRIISFSDKRWSLGEVYISNGFTKMEDSPPGYYYVNGTGIRFDRQLFMKHKLRDRFANFDENLTEEQNCKNNGLYRIWNCGMDKWGLVVE